MPESSGTGSQGIRETITMYEQLNDLLINLCRTISTRKLYFDGHPKVQSLASEFMGQMREFCKMANMDKLFIGVNEGNIIFEGKNLVGPSIVGKQLVLFMEKLRCGGFSISMETTEQEFELFLDLTTELQKPLESIIKARELLVQRNINTIEIAQQYIAPSGPMIKDEQAVWQGQDSASFFQSPTLIYQALFDTVAQAHGEVAEGGDIDIDNTRSVSEYMLHFTRTHFSDLMQHVHYPDYDSYTVGHSVRVAALAVFFANSHNWNEELLLSIATAGLLHDIGKSMIPDEILFKPGQLNVEEFSAMTAHAQLGAEILLGHQNTTPLDIAAAWGHHIRHDGKGYPQQPSWAIRHPLTSLLQICDTFEALTAARPYKPSVTPYLAFCIMLKDKNCFHPNLLASFISTVGIYPPGNIVLLSDGRKGVVMATGQRIGRPRIKIINDQGGDEIPEGDQYLVDLSAPYAADLKVKELLLNTSQGLVTG